jgi:hypothetical protein
VLSRPVRTYAIESPSLYHGKPIYITDSLPQGYSPWILMTYFIYNARTEFNDVDDSYEQHEN